MKRIARKIFLGMLALVAVMLLVLWAFQAPFLGGGYMESKHREITSRAGVLAAMINGGEDTAAYIDRLGQRYNTDVMLISTLGGIYYRSRPFTNDELSLSMQLWRYEQTPFSNIVRMSDSGVHYAIALEPLDDGGTLVALTHLADVTETVQLLSNQFLWMSVAMGIAAALCAGLISSILSRSIQSLEHQAAALANGDLNTQIEPGTRDEIGRLAHTLEYLRLSLKRSDRLRRELIGNVSHELRTPLSIIRGFAETVRDITWKDTEKRERQLNAIVDETQRLTKIVEDILDYSQLESGAMKYSFGEVDLSAEAEKLFGLQREYFERGGMAFVCKIQPGAIVWGDAIKLGQVMFNLISNAFNHGMPGESVEVNLTEESGKAFFRVVDHGEGIPPEQLENIWQRYYRATARGRGERMGSGMGLAIVQTILEAHKAEYGVNSVVGEGSEFYFALPLRKKHSKRLPAVK